MAESIVQVTSAGSTKLHTWNRTIGANSVEDEFTLPGLNPYATYSFLVGGISGATSSDHMLQIMAGASLNVYILRIKVQQAAVMTTAAEFSCDIFRLTSAGTGGTSATARPMDGSDSAAGCTGMTLPTVKGTESGSALDRLRFWGIQTIGAGGLAGTGPLVEWTPRPFGKPIRIAAGTSNGIALKVATGRAAITCDLAVDLVELNY